jgi:hypothetical protein
VRPPTKWPETPAAKAKVAPAGLGSPPKASGLQGPAGAPPGPQVPPAKPPLPKAPAEDNFWFYNIKMLTFLFFIN